MGFSHTHLNGTGCPDLGDILVMPRIGKLITNTGTKEKPFPSMRSHIRFETQKASPGYYSVFLDDFGIKAEVTTTEHCGYHRYTFPQSDSAHIVVVPSVGVSLDGDNTGWSEVKIVNDSTIEGYRESFGWVPNQKVYFVMRFSKSFENFETSFWGNPNWGRLISFGNWQKNGSVFGSVHFKTKKDEVVDVRVGISAVSVNNAYQNLNVEIPTWGFENVVAAAKQKWNDVLSKIEIEATPVQKEIFYTGIYHAYIQPNNIADVNGEYPTPNSKIDKSDSGKYYSTFSLWDTYRAAHPLYSLLTPELNTDFVKSMIQHFEHTGLLPIWTLWGKENYCMIGNHAIPVIVDAYFKGLLDKEWTERAYKAIVATSVNSSLFSNWEVYNKHGYFPHDIVTGESVSKTLEVSFDDWCVASMAKALGKDTDYEQFAKRANYYQNLFDASTGFFRAKNSTGNWRANFNPLEVSYAQGFTEANAWQYLWYVPQDVPKLIELLGGQKKFVQKLDSLFSLSVPIVGHQADVTGLIGQYAHGNEPSHHIAYLYNYAGRYDKTQQIIRQIIETQYSNQPDGLSGNEDCGQMSAWYIFSSLGFYPVNPASGVYDIGVPIVKNATIRLDNGKVFTIKNNLKNEKALVKSVWLNGKLLKDRFISHKQITEGGELVFK
jgi:predicted alpha-1,2-mannosidase